MTLTNIKLGDYIKRSTKNNNKLLYGEELIEGVNNQGIFTHPKGSTKGVNLKPYKIIENGAFVYNPTRLNIGSIAYRTDGLCIVSHLYIVFYLTEEGKKIIHPDYLFMYFRRKEFLREVEFRNFGSQRPEFSFKDMSEIIVPLPPLHIQKKYVEVYKSMLDNQKAYETGLEDLKLVCDATIEKLRKELPSQKIEPFINRVDVRNSDNSIKNVKGVSVKKVFRTPTSKVNTKELSNYKIVKPREITFVQTTHNEKVFAFALNNTTENIVVTSVNEVFETDKKTLLPEFLVQFFNRTEFDRYARFHSWGSARETFTWNDICQVKIPIPNIDTQQSIAEMYNAYITRKEINEKLKQQIKDICPILIAGAIKEANANG